MEYKSLYYLETPFGGFTDIDGTIAFYVRINSLITTSCVLLDVGCGRGSYGEDQIAFRRELRMFKDKCKKVIGIDVDPAARENRFLDEFRHIESNRWPVDDGTVDICICDNVLEHVEEPNLMSYIGMLSKLIPGRLHAIVLGKVQSKRKEKDVFPTLYRCNTQGKVRSMLEKYGFDHCVYGYEAEPSYLSFSRFFYLLGVIHQRFIPNIFKVTIFAFGKKK
jgi:hypothetical protein